MGNRGCGYGSSVSGNGETRPWIWGKGRSLWEERPCRLYGAHLWDRLKVTNYGFMSNRSERLLRDDLTCSAFLGNPLWDRRQVTGYGVGVWPESLCRQACIRRKLPVKARLRQDIRSLRYPDMGWFEGNRSWDLFPRVLLPEPVWRWHRVTSYGIRPR